MLFREEKSIKTNIFFPSDNISPRANRCLVYYNINGLRNSTVVEKESFQGTLMFASLNQMNYKFTKRQDDIISLCYMIFYILNNSEMPGLDSFINSEKLFFLIPVNSNFSIIGFSITLIESLLLLKVISISSKKLVS